MPASAAARSSLHLHSRRPVYHRNNRSGDYAQKSHAIDSLRRYLCILHYCDPPPDRQDNRQDLPCFRSYTSHICNKRAYEQKSRKEVKVMVLYINCCVRKDSRTDRLARAVLEKTGFPQRTSNLLLRKCLKRERRF